MGRRIATTLPDSSVAHTSYWLTGQEKASWGSQTNPTVKLYTAQGQLAELRTFRSTNLALAPDETTASYDATTWAFNTRNQLTRKEYANGKGTNYSYTTAGRLASRTWARGVVTTYGYNSAGAHTSTDYSDSTPDVTIAYDKLGRPVTQSNSIAQSAYTYDATTLALISETLTNGAITRVLDRSQDNLGRETGFQLKNGPAIEHSATYGYSATDGRLESMADGTDTFFYLYTPGSNLLASVTGPTHTVTNTWEASRNILASKENKAGTTVVSNYAYSVNSLNQRSALASTGSAFLASPTWDWTYDSLGQLITADSSVNAQDRSYLYDAIGNRKKSADSLTLPGTDNYVTNALNQYTGIDQGTSVNPVHDFDGNATAYPLPIDQSTNATLVWDGENRLISVTANAITTTYEYDYLSRRISKTIGSSDTINFFYDGWNLIAEYTDSTLEKTYTWGMDLSGSVQGAGGVGGLLKTTSYSLLSPGEAHYPTYDGNGNVSEYLDDGGSFVAHYEYDPFGRITVKTGAKADDFLHRFSTKPLDQETGLYYYGYRYYDPETGRWPSRDPIEEKGGINLYGFVGNNSVNQVDYLGMYNLQFYNLSSAEIIKVASSMGRVAARIDELIEQIEKLIDCTIKSRDKGLDTGRLSPGYGNILSELYKSLSIHKAVKNGIAGGSNLEVENSNLGSRTYALAVTSLISIIDPVLELNTNPSMNWTAAKNIDLDTTIFHELSHVSASTKDNSEYPDDYANWHLDPAQVVQLGMQTEFCRIGSVQILLGDIRKCCCEKKK